MTDNEILINEFEDFKKRIQHRHDTLDDRCNDFYHGFKLAYEEILDEINTRIKKIKGE